MGRSYRGRPSTDGTALGADIAETMGTDDDNEIIREGVRNHREYVLGELTGMDEEQRDWEGDEEDVVISCDECNYSRNAKSPGRLFVEAVDGSLLCEECDTREKAIAELLTRGKTSLPFGNGAMVEIKFVDGDE